MIPEEKLLGWERLAERANAPPPHPAGYQAALEEDARRLVREQLVRLAIPALIVELRSIRQGVDELDVAFACASGSIQAMTVSIERLRSEVP